MRPIWKATPKTILPKKKTENNTLNSLDASKNRKQKIFLYSNEFCIEVIENNNGKQHI